MEKHTRKKIEKVLLIIVLAIIAFVTIGMLFNYCVEAGEVKPDKYKPGSVGEVEGADKLLTIGNSIIGFLQVVGIILLVVMLVLIGIKYMVGSAEEKAEYKKSMQPYLVGAVMIFAITSLLKVIAYFAQNVIYKTN